MQRASGHHGATDSSATHTAVQTNKRMHYLLILAFLLCHQACTSRKEVAAKQYVLYAWQLFNIDVACPVQPCGTMTAEHI